jgi:hypothetical protein
LENRNNPPIGTKRTAKRIRASLVLFEKNGERIKTIAEAIIRGK